MNEVTDTGQTALHIAVHQGHARIVERLVGFGIDLNLQDSDGDTALHIALSRDATETLSAETPQLNKVLRLLSILPHHFRYHIVENFQGVQFLLCHN